MADALYCTYCGGRFQQEDWPRTCGNCGKTTFRNPLPVVVVLLPVTAAGGADPASPGLLVIRRAVRSDPGHGRLALPGGFIDYKDPTWQAAAAREVWEETGIRLPPDGFREFAVRSAPDHTLLFFVLAQPVAAADLPKFAGTNETNEMTVVPGPQELAFPLHTEVARLYFERRGGMPGAAHPL